MRLLTCALVFMLCGCATRPKHYTAPDASAVLASSSRLAAAVDHSRATAARAASAVAAAQTHVSRETALAAEARAQLTALFKLTPPELQPLVDAVNAKVEELSAAHAEVIERLDDAGREHATLRTQLDEAEAAKAQFSKDAQKYLGEADKLANDASRERAVRIKAEESLSWYRWHWWGSWIALGLGVLACGLLAFLKFTGRLALKL